MKKIKAKDFDEKFEEGKEDITQFLDTENVKKVNPSAHKRINLDLPNWMIVALDSQARHIGITRQSIIKVWLAERLQQMNKNIPSNNT